MSNPVLQSESFERAAYALSHAMGAAGAFQVAVQDFTRAVDKLQTLMAMQAENDQRKVLGHSMAYDESAFLNVR